MVVVKLLDGSEETFLIADDTVDSLKEAILERLGIALESQVLVHNKQVLGAGTLLASSSISASSVVILTLLTNAGETLREVFKRFDLNGDGTISRAELWSVLTSIDADMWTDARIDQLFQSFDASKDSLIQFDEFCEWLGMAGVQGSTSLDVITKTMGEVLITTAAAKVTFSDPRDDDEDTHRLTLNPDGLYEKYDDRQKELSGHEATTTGTYKIVRSMVPMMPHKLVLYPLLESGEGWSSGGGAEWKDKDVSSSPPTCCSIEADLRTLKQERGRTYCLAGKDEALCFRFES